MKKSLDDLLEQMMMAYDRGLISGFTYDNLAHRVIMGFMLPANIPVQNLVTHIELCYPTEHVCVKNNPWGLQIEIQLDDGVPRRESAHRTYAKF